MIKKFLKQFYAARLLNSYYRAIQGRKSQSDESAILNRLVKATNAPPSFIEFGFNIHEFNCIDLAKTFSGLLIDGDEAGVRIARHFLPDKVTAKSLFLTLDNIGFIESKFAPGSLGILSIDVDGNDYWFLERLLKMQPVIISCEYNASFGLRPVTVPYDSEFDRTDKHPSGWYHGASLTALTSLCAKRGYDLVAVDSGGANGFFVRSAARPPSMPVLDPTTSYRENQLRNAWSGTVAATQWQAISHLPFASVE